MFRFTAVLTAAIVLLVGLPVATSAAPPACEHVAARTDGDMALCLDADLDTTWIEDVR